MKKLLLIVALFAFIGTTVSTTASVIDDNTTSIVVNADMDQDQDLDKDKDKDKKKKSKKKAKCASDCKTKCGSEKSKCSKETKKACCPGHGTKKAATATEATPKADKE